MSNRFLMPVVLAIACALAGSNLAFAASNPSVLDGPTLNSVNLPDADINWFRHAGTENSSRSAKDMSGLPELAQIFVPIAAACYTYVGRVCLMEVAVPVGSSCTCYFPDVLFPA